MEPAFDVIVVGLGAMGSAAAYQAARRGYRVLGLEQFAPGHDRGSSHGYHRLIRLSSFNQDGYVPLAERAMTLWRELEAAGGETLLTMTGEVALIDPGANPGYAANVERMIARGRRERLSADDLAARFPGFRLTGDMFATYEATAGFLRSELGIITHARLAARHGATLRTETAVTGWAPDGDGVMVTTTAGSYRAARLILAAGPWSAELLGGLTFPMAVQRRVNAYFQPARPDLWTLASGAPDFLLDVPEGSFYGMPAVGDIGLKIGVACGEVTTARTIRREIDTGEVEFLRQTLDRYLPGAAGPVLKQITCMCTYTVDGDFIIDRHPGAPRVVFGCGFSGRGYKFAPVIGEILVDLATTGATRHDIGFLGAGRFAAAAR